MNKLWTIFFLALFIILVLFSGFPGSWKTFIVACAGLMIAALSLLEAVKDRLKNTYTMSGKPGQEYAGDTSNVEK